MKKLPAFKKKNKNQNILFDFFPLSARNSTGKKIPLKLNWFTKISPEICCI